MKNTLLSTALIIGSFAAVSLGANKPITGDLNVGWDNYYNYHNLVPTSQLVGSGATTIAANLQYEIPSVVNLVANFSNTQLDSAQYLYNSNIADQTTLFVGAEGQKWEGLTTSFGYQLTDGGIAGMFSGMNKAIKKVKSGTYDKSIDHTSMDHQLRLDATYQVKDSGLYFTGGAAYSVHGTQGWQMNVGAGYVWTVSDQVDVILSGDVSFSQNYMRTWTGKETQKYNGTDGYSITLSAPIQATQTVVITPYISSIFAGHNAKGISQDLTRDNDYFFKDFAIVAGVSATWSF